MESRAEGYLPRNIYHVPLYLDTRPAEGEIALPREIHETFLSMSVRLSDRRLWDRKFAAARYSLSLQQSWERWQIYATIFLIA